MIVLAVQHERGPRNSTIRRQVAMYLKESTEFAGTGTLVPGGGMLPFAARPPFLPPGLITATPEGVPVISTAALEHLPAPLQGVLLQPTPKVRI